MTKFDHSKSKPIDCCQDFGKCIGCIANFNGECAADECKGPLVVFAHGKKIKNNNKASRKLYYEEMCKIFNENFAKRNSENFLL